MVSGSTELLAVTVAENDPGRKSEQEEIQTLINLVLFFN